jgi:hypothetical protein
VSEEWVGKRQFLALRFCHGRLNGSAFNNLAGALHTDRVACTLSVGREVKMEIPVKMDGQEPAGIVLDPVANRPYVGMGDVLNGVSVVKVVDLNKRAIVAEWSTARNRTSRDWTRNIIACLWAAVWAADIISSQENWSLWTRTLEK